MPRRLRWFWVVTTIVLVAIVALVVFTVIPRPPVNRIVNGNLLKVCSTPWPPELPESESQNVSRREQFQVILASPGQIARLCVGYTSDNYTGSIMLQPQAQIVAANPGLPSSSSSSSLAITVTVQPAGSVDVPPGVASCGLSPCGQSVAYVLYTLTIPSST